MRTKALILALLSPLPAAAHPHIFVDVGLEVMVDDQGLMQQVQVTWAYDALYSLLITEDLGLDADGDAVLTPQEEAALNGFDMQWVEGYNGDLVATLDGAPLTLSGPKDTTAVMREGRIVTTHRRDLAEPVALSGALLSMKPYDVTFYTAYDVTLAVTVAGLDGCSIGKLEPDLDREMTILQEQLARLGRDQDAVEMGFPEVGAAFATDVQVTCAGF